MPVPLLNCVPVVADSTPGSFNTGAAQIEAVLTPEQRASTCRRGVGRFRGAFGHAGGQSSP
jgi:hypothetical protein